MKLIYFRSIRYLLKGLLGYLAYISIIPVWLSPYLNKIRGVKIYDHKSIYIAPGVLIDSIYPEYITIEDGVYITRGVKILSHTNLTPDQRRLVNVVNIIKKVHISRGAFIGVNAIILPGVHVGECALIAAGAVVTANVPKYAIVAGNPAKVIGDIRELRNES